MLGFTVVKNALANIVRGGATAVVALVLPHFLTRALDTDRFAAWALMLQIAAYAGYLDFGLQTTVARYFSQAIERGDHDQRDKLVSTAFGLLTGAAVLVFAVIGAVVWQLPRLFSRIPAALVGDMRGGVLVLAASAALMLPMSAFTGVLIGLHRNEYPALAIGGSRIAGAISVLLVVKHTHSLVWLASCVAATNLLGGVVQVVFAKFLVPSLQIAWSLASVTVARNLSAFSAGIMIWSLSGLLVSGLDLTVLGYFSFKSVGYYAIGSALVVFIAGINGAVSSALMTPLAALHATAATDRIRSITLRVTRLGTYVNILLTCGIFLAGHLLLRAWVGNSYALQADPILEILMVATTIRLVAGPYGAMLIATGQQRQGIAQGVVEGVTNLVSSIALAYWLGPIGVAIGTLVGAVCGLLWTCIFTLSWAKEFPLPRSTFVLEGILRPIAGTLPLLLFTALWYKRPVTSVSLGVLAICCALTYLLTARLSGVLPARLQLSHASRGHIN